MAKCGGGDGVKEIRGKHVFYLKKCMFSQKIGGHVPPSPLGIGAHDTRLFEEENGHVVCWGERTLLSQTIKL